MKILIVDDEQLARERLVDLITEIDTQHELIEASNGAEAIEKHTEQQTDLLLLDIRMPVMDGLETASHLCKLDNPPAVVFTTAYGDHALEAFEADAVDYLLKPIGLERLATALEKSQTLQHGRTTTTLAKENSPTTRTHLSAKSRLGLKVVPVTDLLYFKAEQKYVSAVYSDGELVLDEPLKSLEEEFGDRFIRIHRNTLVAVRAIDSLQRDASGNHNLSVRGITESLAVSRRHLSQVKKTIKALG